MKAKKLKIRKGKWQKKLVAVALGMSLASVPMTAYADHSNIPMQIIDYVFKFLQDKAQQELNRVIRKVPIPGMDLSPLLDLIKIENLDPRVAEIEATASERYSKCNERVAKDNNMPNTDGNLACRFEYDLETKRTTDRVGVTSSQQSGHNVATSRRAAGEIANRVYNQAVEQGVVLLKPRAAEQAEKDFVDSIHREAKVNPDAMAGGNDDQLRLLSSYLTMYPVIPVGNGKAGAGGEAGNEWFQNPDEQSRLLATALVGIREVSVMDQKTLNEGGYFLQAERYKKYARIQYARMVILQSLHPGVIASMQDMYNNYVATPSDKELGGIDKDGNPVKGLHYSMEQLAQLQIRQLQAVNWNLLEIRRLQLEGNRVNAVLLAVMEDGAGDVGGRGGGIGVGGEGGSPSAKVPSRSQIESYGVNE